LAEEADAYSLERWKAAGLQIKTRNRSPATPGPQKASNPPVTRPEEVTGVNPFCYRPPRLQAFKRVVLASKEKPGILPQLNTKKRGN